VKTTGRVTMNELTQVLAWMAYLLQMLLYGVGILIGVFLLAKVAAYGVCAGRHAFSVHQEKEEKGDNNGRRTT